MKTTIQEITIPNGQTWNAALYPSTGLYRDTGNPSSIIAVDKMLDSTFSFPITCLSLEPDIFEKTYEEIT